MVMNKRHFAAAILLAAFMLTLAITPIASQQVRTYDPWVDINEDGKIEGKDIASIAKLFGTSGTPINRTALLEFDRRIRTIEEYINEISRVELLASSGNTYYFGVSGHWNITKLQTEPFQDTLNSTIGGALLYCNDFDNTYYSLQAEGKGYTQLINMNISRELNPTEIEDVRLLIKSWLAQL
jgi:hypothetical protein